MSNKILTWHQVFPNAPFTEEGEPFTPTKIGVGVRYSIRANQYLAAHGIQMLANSYFRVTRAEMRATMSDEQVAALIRSELANVDLSAIAEAAAPAEVAA